MFDDATFGEIIDALTKGQVTRSQTAVDLAADILCRKGINLSDAPTPSMQLEDYLRELQRRKPTDDNTALLGAFLDSLQNASKEAGFVELVKVRSNRFGHQLRSTKPFDSTRKFPERILFRDETLPISYLENGAAAAKAVGKLIVPVFFGKKKRPDTSKGTAWLLTKQHIVTCVHVVYAKDKRPTAEELDLQITNSEFQIGSPPYPKVKTKVALWPEIDIAILELSTPVKGARPLTCSEAALVKPEETSGFYVNVIQYPLGEDQRVGLRANAALDVTDDDLYYFTDTEKGASGAPCFDDEWLVIGVHRAYELRENLKYLGRSAGHVNVGTRITEVLARIDADKKLAALKKQISRSS